MLELLKIFNDPKKILQALEASNDATVTLRGWITTEVVTAMMQVGFFDDVVKGVRLPKWAKKKS